MRETNINEWEIGWRHDIDSEYFEGEIRDMVIYYRALDEELSSENL